MTDSQVKGFELESLRKNLFFENEVLNSSEAAEFLGIAKKTLYKWVSTKGLPVKRIGKTLRFIRDDLVEWLRKD